MLRVGQHDDLGCEVLHLGMVGAVVRSSEHALSTGDRVALRLEEHELGAVVSRVDERSIGLTFASFEGAEGGELESAVLQLLERVC